MDTKKRPTILVVDDEKSIRYTFSEFLTKEGYSVVQSADYGSAVDIITQTDLDVLFVDIILEEHSGIDILKLVKQEGRHSPVIMITGQPNLDTSAAAVRGGAFDYIPKPIRKETLLRIAEHALRHKRLLDEKIKIQEEKEHYRKNLEAIFSSLKDGIITVDNNLNIIEVNNAVNDICDIQPQYLIGKSFDEVEVDCCKSCLKVLKETLHSKAPVKEFRVACPNGKGKDRIVLLTCSPLINEKQEFTGAVLVIRDITQLITLEKELKDRHHFNQLIGKSWKMQKIYRLLEDLIETDTTVLISGESGTGKEVVARVLHYSGVRAAKPLVTVNCSALAENLLESELFGHVKGAFTGAIKDKAGRFQIADGGTIFLDEIGDISPLIQLKLLRVLQERQFERVGDSKTIKVDVRILAATNQELKKKVRLGEFREDLYYRLNVINVKLPPLRERRDDIPLLTDHFCKKYCKKMNKNINRVADDTLEYLMNYHWPGNIRELEHAIEHAFVLCHDRIFLADYLPSEIIKSVKIKKELLHETDFRNDKERVFKALSDTGWNKAKAARILGISRPTLYKKIQDYHLAKNEE